MPRAIQHYLRGYVWHITHRCHKEESLFKFDQDQRRRVRLSSDIGYVTPEDKREGSVRGIFGERDRKLEAPRELRWQRRQELRERMGENGCRPVAPVLN